jgi:hypothetical protein
MDFLLPENQPPPRSARKRDLYRLVVARSDVTAAYYGCELLLERVRGFRDSLYYPLFASVVVCYARPFTRNRPFGPLPQKWARFPDPTLQNAHRKMIKARNELIAHSDTSVRKARIIPPGYLAATHDGKDFRSEEVGVQVESYYIEIPFFRTALKTASDLGRRLESEIDLMIRELYGGMELPSRPFELRVDEGL